MTAVASGPRPTSAQPRRPYSLDRAVGRVIEAAAVLITAFGWKQFSLWDQVLVLRGSSPVDLVIEGHPHALRYLTVWPTFAISDALDLNANRVFSLVAAISVVALMRLTASAALIVDTPTFPKTKASTVWFVVYLVALDGRLVIALAGFALLVLVLLQVCDPRTTQTSTAGQIARVATALLLTSVTTGALAVACLSLLAVLVADARSLSLRRKRAKMRVLVPVAAVAVLASVPLVRKNLEFLRSNVGALVSHGFGDELLPVAALALISLPLALPLLRRRATPRGVLYRCGGSAALCGIAGMSALALGTVPLLVFVTAEPPTRSRAVLAGSR